MRILHVVTAFPCFPNDIISPWLVEMLKRLRAAGHDVEVFAPAYRGGGNREFEGIPIHRFRYFPARWEDMTHDQATLDRLRRSPRYKMMPLFYVLGGVWAAWRLARRRRYDVVHVHWPLPHALFGWAARRACGARMVTSWYGVELRWVRSSLPWLKRFLVWALRASDQVVAISSATAREITNLVPVGVRVIPYTVGFPEAAPGSSLPPAGDSFVILFVGSPVERKGVRYLVDALPLLPADLHAKLVIIGDGAARSRLEAQGRERGAQPRVEVRGRAPEPGRGRGGPQCRAATLQLARDHRPVGGVRRCGAGFRGGGLVERLHRLQRAAGWVLQSERRRSTHRRVGVDSPVGRQAPDADAATGGAPFDHGAHRPDEGLLRHEAAQQRVKGGRGVREAECRRQVGVPQPDPKPLHLPADLCQRLPLGDPRPGVLDPRVLAQRAIHPAERHLVQTDRPLRYGVPDRDDVGDPQAEAVAVREPPRRVIAETRRQHTAMGCPWAHAEKVLPHSEDRAASQSFKALALLCEELRAVACLKAPVQADLAASLSQLVQDRHRRRGLRSVREISRPHGGERGGPAEHEPGRDHAVVALVVEQAAHGLANRVAPYGGERRPPGARPPPPRALAGELGDRHERKRRPVRDDIEGVGEGGGPPPAVGPWGGECHRAAVRARDDGGAQPYCGPGYDGIGFAGIADQQVLPRRHPAVPSARPGALLRGRRGDVRNAAQHDSRDAHDPVGALEVPVPRDAGLEIGIARITLGHEQAHHVGRGVVHGRDTSEIDEEIKTVALDAGQSLARGQADHEFVQYTRELQPPTRRLILPGTRVH